MVLSLIHTIAHLFYLGNLSLPFMSPCEELCLKIAFPKNHAFLLTIFDSEIIDFLK